MKKFIVIALLVAFGVAGFILISGNAETQPSAGGVDAGVGGSRVVASYFHTTFRCPTCHKIEQYTEGALKDFFGGELESGSLVYRVVNVEDKGNEHFVQDYQLYTKSVVLSLVKDGEEVRFKNLERVWQNVGSKDKFYEYIEGETRLFLDELGGGGS
ncbi:MAG: nitrophenyl compound nitroreductase subunit ArsF family protein [Candidatus Bathyarchaeota archaeon]